MSKYFYLVEFEYKVTDDYSSSFNLGVFLNKNLANKKIEMSADYLDLINIALKTLK